MQTMCKKEWEGFKIGTTYAGDVMKVVNTCGDKQE